MTLLDLHWEETPEEKHERIDRILVKNSQKPLVCISCLELITDQQTMISTSFGPYHGAPFTCEEGRNEKDIPWYQK